MLKPHELEYIAKYQMLKECYEMKSFIAPPRSEIKIKVKRPILTLDGNIFEKKTISISSFLLSEIIDKILLETRESIIKLEMSDEK